MSNQNCNISYNQNNNNNNFTLYSNGNNILQIDTNQNYIIIIVRSNNRIIHNIIQIKDLIKKFINKMNYNYNIKLISLEELNFIDQINLFRQV